MIDVLIVLKDGSSVELPFVPNAFEELVRQFEAGENDTWDLGGVRTVETKDIKEVIELGTCVQCGSAIPASEDHCSHDCVNAYVEELENIVAELVKEVEEDV